MGSSCIVAGLKWFSRYMDLATVFCTRLSSYQHVHTCNIYIHIHIYSHMYMYMLPLFVSLKVYDRNVVNKYLLLGVIIYNLIDYIHIYIVFFFFSHNCPLLISLYNIVVLVKMCRFLNQRC